MVADSGDVRKLWGLDFSQLHVALPPARSGADAPIIEIGGGLWIRLSAQAYNRLDDYARLGDLIDALKD